MFKRTAVPPAGTSHRQARQPLNMALGLSKRTIVNGVLKQGSLNI